MPTLNNIYDVEQHRKDENRKDAQIKYIRLSFWVLAIPAGVSLFEKFSSFKIWSNVILPFLKWQFSGWVILLAVLITIFILQMSKIRALYYLNKYGDKSKIRGLYFLGPSGKVYLVTKDGYLRWIKNQDTLFEIGYDFNDVLKGNRSWFKNYKAGTSISVYFWK